MSRGSRGTLFALGGLLAVAAVGAGIYSLRPNPPRFANTQQQEQPGYRPGGPGCNPKRLDGLKARQAATERQRCADTQEQYRLQIGSLNQARRAADAGEEAARQAYNEAQAAAYGDWIEFLTLISAMVAVLFAGRTYSAYLEAERPRLVISLGNFNWNNQVVRFDIIVTNVGAKGCVLTAVSYIWVEKGQHPQIMMGHFPVVPIPAGESRTITPITVFKEPSLAERPELVGFVRYEGPFVADEGGALERFRFHVHPAPTSPHQTFYRPVLDLKLLRPRERLWQRARNAVRNRFSRKRKADA